MTEKKLLALYEDYKKSCEMFGEEIIPYNLWKGTYLDC